MAVIGPVRMIDCISNAFALSSCGPNLWPPQAKSVGMGPGMDGRRFQMILSYCLLVSILLISPFITALSGKTEGPLSALPKSEDSSGSYTASVTLGGTIKLDHLGPVIVGEDGTLRRITNWAHLTPSEREVAFRRIASRNKERLASLTLTQQGSLDTSEEFTDHKKLDDIHVEL